MSYQLFQRKPAAAILRITAPLMLSTCCSTGGKKGGADWKVLELTAQLSIKSHQSPGYDVCQGKGHHSGRPYYLPDTVPLLQISLVQYGIRNS